jgi:hypothetical protein
MSFVLFSLAAVLATVVLMPLNLFVSLSAYDWSKVQALLTRLAPSLAFLGLLTAAATWFHRL